MDGQVTYLERTQAIHYASSAMQWASQAYMHDQTEAQQAERTVRSRCAYGPSTRALGRASLSGPASRMRNVYIPSVERYRRRFHTTGYDQVR